VNYGVGWGRANYHPGAKAGDGTDAGAVAIMLLEHLVATGGQYTFDGYAAHWLAQIEAGYGSCNFQSVGREWVGDCPPGTRPGYLNGGTRRTLDALKRFPGATGEQRKSLAADVNCLVSATHWPPLLLLKYSNEDALAADAVSTVYLSHRNRDPVAAAEFLSRATFRILRDGMSLEAALKSAAEKQGDAFISARLAEALAKVAEAADVNSQLAKQGRFIDDVAITSLARLWEVGKEEPIKVGKASPVEGALPAAIYFAMRYQGSLEEALIANANVGGDSAARGIVIGTLLGAVHGEAAIPERWMKTLNSLPRVRSLLEQLEAGKHASKTDL
jgi:ADP-ribosylglycohydrolase